MIQSVTVTGKRDREVMVAINPSAGEAAVVLFDGNAICRVVVPPSRMRFLLDTLASEGFREAIEQACLREMGGCAGGDEAQMLLDLGRVDVRAGTDLAGRLPASEAVIKGDEW